jgi:phage terminase Nu1 subunit (DNA packaging protein)
MTETVAASVTKPRPRSRKLATVSASALALHLDCSRTYVGKLEAEGVIQRQGGGFPLDLSRVAYLRYLRRERQQSPRSEADAEHAKAKAALLRLRIAEKQRELVPRADFDAVIDGIAGVVLTHLSGMAARCSNDLMVRRKIDAVVYEVCKEMAKVALEMADKNGEPPLEQQAAN